MCGLKLLILLSEYLYWTLEREIYVLIIKEIDIKVTCHSFQIRASKTTDNERKSL